MKLFLFLVVVYGLSSEAQPMRGIWAGYDGKGCIRRTQEVPTPSAQMVSYSKASEMADELNVTWGDDNITTGTATIQAVRLSINLDSEKAIQSLHRKAFKNHLGESLPKKAVLKTEVVNFNADVLNDIGRIIAVDGFAADSGGSNRRLIRETVKPIKPILKEFGINFRSAVVTKTVALVENNNDPEDLRRVSHILIVNKKTREGVAIFIIEGRM